MESIAQVPRTPALHHEGRLAAEIVRTGAEALRGADDEGGALARAVTRAEQICSTLSGALEPAEVGRTVVAAHNAIAHAIAIGQAAEFELDDRARHGLHALAAAQQILYPVVCEAAAQGGPEVTSPWVDDRRRAPRVELCIEVSFESESNFYHGFSEDLSDGGLFVATYGLQPVGSFVDLELTLPDGHVVRARGEVRWLRDPRNPEAEVSPGMGLRFDALLPEDREAIQAFTGARVPLFFDDEDG